MVAAARPFEAVGDVVDVLLDQLSRRGLGEWSLQDAWTEPLLAHGRTTVPIALPDGSLMGLLQAPGEADQALSLEELASVHEAARVMATLLDAEGRADRSYRRAVRAEAESMTDALTGLPNGRAWWRALLREGSRCDRHGLSAVVAVIDLDELKIINDSHGHLAGDLLLRTLAETLSTSMRETDLVARLGGDEFGVLAVDYHAPVPDTMVGRLRDSIDAADIKASVGADVYRPGDVIDDTFHRADSDMYRVKRAGRPAS